MTLIPRWAIVWKNLDTGRNGIGEGLFVSKEEALEFAQLVGRPDTIAAGATVLFDAEMVFVDPERPLVQQVLEQLSKQQP